MATDDERRRVAERLRGGYDVAGDGHRRFWFSGTLFGMNVTARSEEQIRDGLSRLADLIDPGETSQGCRDTVACDRDALLALADELESEGLEGWASGPIHVGEYARRIREACGEAGAKPVGSEE